MKIGFTTFEVPWTFMGGVEIHTVELAKALSKKGEDVHIYTKSYKDNQKSLEVRDGVKIHYIPIPQKFDKLREENYLHFKRFVRPIFKRNLKKIITKEDIDIIHSQHYSGSSLVGINTPMIATIHTSIPQEFREGKLPLPRGVPQRFLISLDMLKTFRFHAKIDETIVVSENVKKELKNIYGIEPILIPNGAPKPNKIDKKMAKEYLDIDFEKVILYFGRIERIKGPHKLLEVLKNDELEDVGIVYGGKGSFLDELRSQIRKEGLEDRVKILGYVPDKDKKYCFSAADCFALPSESEGQPITLLEAISYGLPCYVTDKKWVPDYIRDCGVDGKIRRGIKKTLKMRIDGSRVKNWEDIAEETIEVYEKII